MVKVLSVGGSIVAPDKPDTEFLSNFNNLVRDWLKKDENNKLILVVGGGGPARSYQNAYKSVGNLNADQADWIGIMATRLNAQLLKAIFSDLCKNEVVYNPLEVENFDGKILVAAGWKPGFSTDTDAVFLAERFGAKTLVNLSNIEKVYTDDPKTNPNAKPVDAMTWAEFRKMVGDDWVPGKNCPFDPIASKKAQELGLKVICAGGKNILNIQNILEDKTFIGTVIG